MTAPSSQAPGHVDLATLTSGLHVLGVAPAWSAVERALGRLDSVRGSGTSTDDPKVREDLQTVHEFHQLLERSAETVALALLCGAVLGQASSAQTFGERLLAGLRAISRSYGFDRLDEAKRLELLRELRQKLKAEGVVPRSAYNIPRTVRAFDVFAWRGWCWQLRQKIEEAVENATGPDRLRTELPTYQDRAWSLWKDRLAPQPRLERVTWPKVEAVLADLVCAAAGVPPASRLDLDLSRMGLVSWSEDLYWSLTRQQGGQRQSCPPWLIAPALYRLGFRPKVPAGALAALVAELSNLRKSPAATGDEDLTAWIGHWERFLERAARTDRPRVLVIRQADESLTSSWKVAKKGGILALTQAQLESLMESYTRSQQLSWFGFDVLVVEATVTQPSADPSRMASLSHLTYQELPVPMWITRESVPPRTDDLPLIQNPKNADDLIDRASPFLARSAT